MLRMLSLVLLGSSSIAVAQVQPAPPAPPAPPAAPAEPAPAVDPAPAVEAEAAVEEPKMKKVCRQVEVVGSAVGRSVCTMKPIRAPKPKGV